jgi:hypothetical protein
MSFTPDDGDRERGLGVMSIDDAMAAYLSAADELAPLRAKHGTNGTFEHDRKALLANLRVGVRRHANTPAMRTQKALTDAAIDDLAHAHPEYQKFLDLSRSEKQRMQELEAAMNALTMVTNRHNILLRLDLADRTNMPRQGPPATDL